MAKKLEPELKEKIKAYLATCDNIRETARKFNVSPSTVKGIKDEKPDEFEQMRTDKKQQMIETIWSDMTEALDLGRQKIQLAKATVNEFQPTIEKLVDMLEKNEGTNGKDIVELIKALSSITSIPLSHISTYFGTLYDKRALMNNESTANTVTTVKLAGELDEWAN